MDKTCCVFYFNFEINKFSKILKRCAEWISNLNLKYIKNYDNLQKFKVRS
jgi:hypothetical protein